MTALKIAIAAALLVWLLMGAPQPFFNLDGKPEKTALPQQDGVSGQSSVSKNVETGNESDVHFEEVVEDDGEDVTEDDTYEHETPAERFQRHREERRQAREERRDDDGDSGNLGDWPRSGEDGEDEE